MINLLQLELGSRVKLIGGRIAEVVENMGDGQWVLARIVEAPDAPAEIGGEELCHAQDILGLDGGATGPQRPERA